LRYLYPWKLNDWEFAYSMVMKELDGKISNEEEKKKLRADRVKVANKMAKA
jgi:hypothetical protein